jgi:hypothetical protein
MADNSLLPKRNRTMILKKISKHRALTLSEIKSISGGDCYYKGSRYSKGSIIEMLGLSKTCYNGEWI